MRILLDTNIIIHREDDKILSDKLQSLMKTISALNENILVHPLSIDDIKNDNNFNRKEIILSKIKSYNILASPPIPVKDGSFKETVGETLRGNEEIDNNILYAVYKDAADFLITEDKGIHKKAIRLKIKDRVLTIDEALAIFVNNKIDINLSPPPALQHDYVYHLDINDPFFDSLKGKYTGFENWFKDISREHRKCFVHFRKDNLIDALLIYKEENETIDVIDKTLPKKNRLKLCTLKVSNLGNKIGELFIKLSIDYALQKDIEEIYLTLFSIDNEYLIELVSEYGFERIGITPNDEEVYIKRLSFNKDKLKTLSTDIISKKCYPHFYDGEKVNKYIIPIKPEYHDRLFPEHENRQLTLLEGAGEFIVEGNTIKKAYLSHSSIKKLSKGDIVLFYRSNDWQSITSIGVIEDIFYNLTQPEEIVKKVGKRTVYSIQEIEDIAKKPTLVILFTWHFNFKKLIRYQDLLNKGIISGAPQTITSIDNDGYNVVKKEGELNERFAISKT